MFRGLGVRVSGLGLRNCDCDLLRLKPSPMHPSMQKKPFTHQKQKSGHPQLRAMYSIACWACLSQVRGLVSRILRGHGSDIV